MGQGFSENDAEAAKWYRLAAAQGYASAQYNLGVSYADGEGVPQNYTEACIWSSLAAASGDNADLYNPGLAKSAIFNRDLAASKLAPAALVEAQQRATKLFEEIEARKGE